MRLSIQLWILKTRFLFRNPTAQEKIKYGELLSLDLSYFSGQNDEFVSSIDFYQWIFFQPKINNEWCLAGLSQFYDFEEDDFEAEFCRKMLP